MKNLWNGMNQKQRMQTKLFFCILGGILLLVLILISILAGLGGSGGEQKKEEMQEPVHIPVIERLKNVWVMEMDENEVLLFCEGEECRYTYESRELAEQYADSYDSMREQVADVTLTDGLISSVTTKTDKISGRIIRADETGVWLEGHERIAFAEDYKGYRIYQSLAMCTYRDLQFGYDYTDLVIEDGKICALLIAREGAMDTIRVLLKASDYAGIFHEKVTFSVDTDFVITYGRDGTLSEAHAAQDTIVIDGESVYLEEGRAVITPTVHTAKTTLIGLQRSLGTPKYRGTIELLRTEEGMIVVNELPLEEYLYSVLPSEMPAGYPTEALKAQAICARTYAYGHMQRAGYPQYGAHVDDSTAYQVYNNVAEQASTTSAVKETYGELLLAANGECAETYYYSTSCGVGSDTDVWKTESSGTEDYLRAKRIDRDSMNGQGDYIAEDYGEQMKEESVFRTFITDHHPEDFEAEESWYRWSYTVEELDAEKIYERLQKRYESNEKLVLTLEDEAYVSRPIKAFRTIQDLYVAKRGAGGVADELILETELGTYKVITEHNIRWILADGTTKVCCQDGKEVAFPNLLPSAFFVIDICRVQGNVVGYTLIGGGYGHGVGMSQNAAKAMAAEGYHAEDILCFFYENCTVNAATQIIHTDKTSKKERE